MGYWIIHLFLVSGKNLNILTRLMNGSSLDHLKFHTTRSSHDTNKTRSYILPPLVKSDNILLYKIILSLKVNCN